MGVEFIGWRRFPGYCLLIIPPELSAPILFAMHAASDWQLRTPLGILTINKKSPGLHVMSSLAPLLGSRDAGC